VQARQIRLCKRGRSQKARARTRNGTTIDLEEARYSPRAVSQITMLPHAAAIEDPNLCATRLTKAARSVADDGQL